ncbi:MAG TPA: hypothetical protein PK280_05545 [Planctomycetota bacterium]|nr:hypothetical protein [Planctomycetota bacterium]
MDTSRSCVLCCLALLIAVLAGPAAACGGEAVGGKSPPPERLTLKIYDIQELTMQVPDVPGPELYMTGGQSDLPVFQPPPNTPLVTAQFIMDAIRCRIAPETWQPDKNTFLTERMGTLVVQQSPEVHRRIETLLRSFREQYVRKLSVQALILAVDAPTAAKLRLRKSREFDPKEVEELTKAGGPAGLIAAPQVICANGQRNHSWAGRQSSYVSGYSWGDGRGDPTTSTLLEGAVLDVRPTLSFDGSLADVELRLAVTDERHDRKQEVFLSIDGAGSKTPPPGDEGAEKGQPARLPVAGPARTWKGEVTLPSARHLRFRGCISAPLDRYVVAGMLLLPAGQADGQAARRTALALLKVSRTPAPAKAVPADTEDRPNPPGLAAGFYDIQELTATAPSWPGPMLGLPAGNTGRGGGSMVVPAVEVPAIPRGGLQDLAKRTIEPESWGINGTSIQEENGQLIVFHTPAVQRRIRELLVWVRKDRKPQLAVQGMALAVSDEVAERLRRANAVEFSAEEAEALIREAGEGALLAEHLTLCYNLQRVCSTSGRQTSYVSGFISSGAVTTPIMNTLLAGCHFDVRPVLSPDRKAATLELRCSLGSAFVEKEATVISGSLAGEAGAAAAAQAIVNKVSLPQTDIVTVRGNPTAPLGRYVLAGTGRLTGDAAGARPNVLVLVKAEIVPQAASGEQPPASERSERPVPGR